MISMKNELELFISDKFKKDWKKLEKNIMIIINLKKL